MKYCRKPPLNHTFHKRKKLCWQLSKEVLISLIHAHFPFFKDALYTVHRGYWNHRKWSHHSNNSIHGDRNWEFTSYSNCVSSTTISSVVLCVVKRSDCILVYGSTTKSGVVKRSDCILVYGSTTKGDVVKRSNCILVYGSTTKGDVVKRSDCILVYGSTTKGGVVERS